MKRIFINLPRSIILEMKDKSDLYSALEMYIQGELVSDVFCDVCQAKFNTIKRVVFKVRVQKKKKLTARAIFGIYFF